MNRRPRNQLARRAAEALETRALLAVITVTSLDDNLDIDGEVTLREAVLAANGDESVDGSEAGAGADTIQFADGLEGVIALVGRVVIDSNVTILGHGKTKTVVEGSGLSTAFVVEDTQLVDFKQFRIRDFAHAIETDDVKEVRLEGMDITRNSDVGLSVQGATDVGIYRSIFYKNVQAFEAQASSKTRVRVSESRFDGNRGRLNGAAMYVRGHSDFLGTTEVSIYRSTFSNNEARNSENRSYVGAALYLTDVDADITSSTFSGNGFGLVNDDRSSGSDVFLTGQSLKVDHSTFYQSTGANSVYVDGRTNFSASNSIFAGAGGQDFATSTGVVEFGHMANSIVRTNAGTDLEAAPVGTPDANGNMIGTPAQPIDPLLADLAANGATTKTHLPLSGSPAIDAGHTDRGFLFGQRGVPGYAGDDIDIGAAQLVDVKLRVNRAQLVERHDGTTNLELRLTLVEAVSPPITLQYETYGRTATAGIDFESVSGTGQLSEKNDVLTILVPVIGDTEIELDETFGLKLTSTDDRIPGTLRDRVSTIVSDDEGAFVVDGNLHINGSAAGDTIQVSPAGSDLSVKVNGEEFFFPRSDIESIEVIGRNGSDSILIDRSISLPAMVYSGDGNDTIMAGSGDDLIDAGFGKDSVHAGSGDDSVLGGHDNDWLFGEAGHDTINAGPGRDSLDGGGGQDLLLGEYELNEIRGGDGHDRIYAGFGRGEISGGKGDDLIVGSPRNDLILGGTGRDTIVGDAGNDNIRGGADNDEIYGMAGADKLRGDGGNDYVDGGDGKNNISLGDGHDRGFTRTGTIIGGAGSDRLHSMVGGYLRGGADNDLIFAGSGPGLRQRRGRHNHREHWNGVGWIRRRFDHRR